MALSDWDKKNLDANQQRAVQTYTAEWEKARLAGDTARMQWAHSGAEAIRRQAGYSGGAAGNTFTAPTQNITGTTSTASNGRATYQTTQAGASKGFDNGSLTPAQVAQMQAALGVEQDGYFGPKTQAAAFQRWGAGTADSALRAYQSTATPARTSYGFDEDEGVYHWNGQTFASKRELTEAMNKANLSAAEKNILDRKAQGSDIQLQNGSFGSTTPEPTWEDPLPLEAPDLEEEPAGRGVVGHSGSEAPRSVADQIAMREQSRGDFSLLERLKNAVSGGAKNSASAYTNNAGNAIYGEAARQRQQIAGDIKAWQDTIDAYRDALNDPTATKSERETAETMIAELTRRINAYQNAYGAGGANERAAGAVWGAADRVADSAAADIERAKESASDLEKLGVDLTVTGTQMLGDRLMSPIPGMSLVPMAARVLGSSSQEARRSGADFEHAMAYGGASAAVEVLSEQLFDGLAGLYGKGAADDIVKDVIDGLTKNETTRKVLNVIASGIGEGAEELISGLAAPALQTIWNGKGLGRNYSELEARDILYDVLVGGIMGGIGGTVEAVRGKPIYQQTTDETETEEPLRLPTAEEIENGIEPGQAATRPGTGGTEINGPRAGDLTSVQTGGVEAQKNASGEAEAVSLVQQVRNVIPAMNNAPAVASISGTEIPQKGTVVERLTAFANSIGNKINRPGFGDVLFSKTRIKNAFLGHGIGNAKIDAFAAVPAVIRNGQQIGYEHGWKGRGYDSYVFAAPIEYKGKRDYIGVIVTKDARDSRYYVHEVVDADGNLIFGEKENAGDTSDERATLPGAFGIVASPANSNATIAQLSNAVKPEEMEMEGGLPLAMPDLAEAPRADAREVDGGIPLAVPDPGFEGDSRGAITPGSKNAAPEGAAKNTISPAQDAGLSGNPISEPSGQSPGQIATREDTHIIPSPEQLVNPKDAERFQKEHGDRAYVEAFEAAMNKGDIKLDAKQEPFVPKAEDHIDNRKPHDVGNRHVRAFQFQNPEIHPYYEQVAGVLLDELSTAQKGGELIKRGNYWTGEEYTRTKRGASDAIVALRDEFGFSYGDIERALKAIIADEGQENIAVAKRLELLIDELIENDYQSAWGPLSTFVDVEGYRAAKGAIRGARERYRAPVYEAGSFEEYRAENKLALELGEITEDELRAEWEALRPLEAPGPGAAQTTAEEAPPLEAPDLGLGGDGLGGADAGSVNTDYDRLQAQSDKFHPSGPDPVRHTDVPTTNFEGRNIPKSTSTIYGAQGTPDAAVMQLEQMIADGKLAFDTITDKDAVSSAQRTMESKGFEGALEQYRNTVASNAVSKNNTALGQQLLLQAMREGNTAATAELLTLYTRNSTNTAQALQAESIFRKLSPEGQLTAVQKAIDSFNEKYGTDVQMSEEDVGDFVNAGSEAEREAVRKRILENVASAVPGTFKAKYDAIRYLAMLGNPRTHIRNILGNTIFQAPVMVKNRVGAVGELVANAVSGGKVERTKSLTGANPFGSLAKEARADFDNVQNLLGQSHKYSDGQTSLYDLEEKIKAFSDGNFLGRSMNALADGNRFLLEAEDTMAKKFIYTQSLAGYLKANGVKTMQGLADTLEGRQLLDRARNYAAREAMRNTFNDKNAASDAVAKLGGLYRSENPVARGFGYVVEGVLPFKRTPTNILVRSLEYSPVGGFYGLGEMVIGIKSGDSVKITQGLDRLAAGMTGSGLLYLGSVLAGAGLIRGSDDDDDKQAKFDDLRGHQNYSLELPDGTSITLDWLAPEAIPFFMGVELCNSALDGGMSIEGFIQAFRDATAPMLEMSMLQGLNDTFDNAAWAKNSGGSVAGSVLTSALTSYITQVFPTLFGQAERAFGESERMSTYTDKNSSVPSDLQYTLGKVSQKIPGWDYNQIPYIDAWGRTESTGETGQRAVNNFFNPAYVSQISDDAMEDELQRLYDATGEAGVLPQRATKYFTVDGERKDLTGEEYVAYATEKGQLSRELISSFIGSAGYAQMDDAARAKAISELYSYANAKAKESVFGIALNSSAAKIEAAVESGISPAQYFTFNAKLDALTPQEGAKGVSDMQRYRVIAGEDMSDDEKLAAIGAIMGTDMTTENGGKSQYAKMLDVLDAGASIDQYLDLSEAGAVDSYLKYQSVRGRRDYGIKPDAFAEFQTGKNRYDADGNNSYTQKEVAAAIDGIFGDTLTKEQKAVLWQLYNKSWKAKNNPYSTEIGQYVYDDLHDDDDDDEPRGLPTE